MSSRWFRGGGSKADLLYLNDYEIGRAICNCPVPIWSGIGHSTDKTLIDEVAAKSFKTPSDAAHHVVQITAQILQSYQGWINEVARCAQRVSEQMSKQQQRRVDKNNEQYGNFTGQGTCRRYRVCAKLCGQRKAHRAIVGRTPWWPKIGPSMQGRSWPGPVVRA